MASAAQWWFLLGNSYVSEGPLWGWLWKRVRYTFVIQASSHCQGDGGVVERSAILSITCQPFALIFLCQGQRGRSLLLLFFEAMGAMVEYSISHQILFSKLNYCAQMADLVTPAQGLLLVMVVILSKLLSLFLLASLLFFFFFKRLC